MKCRLAVIGGGITGLSASYYAAKGARLAGYPLDISLYEAGSTFGGKIATERRDGFIIERGPDSFLGRKMPIIDLTRELGIEHRLVGVQPAANKTSIVYRNQLHTVPAGLILGIPTQLKSIIRSGLLSPAGKLRAAMDYILPGRSGEEDVNFGELVGRRLGREVVERLVEPIVAGIYAGDIDHLSVQATYPYIQQRQREYRSLMKGMRASSGTAAGNSGMNVPELVRRSPFLNYDNGMATLVDSLVESLREQGVQLYLQYAVDKLHKESADGMGRYTLGFADDSIQSFDAVILTTSANQAAKLLKPYMNVSELEQMKYVSVCNAVLIYRQSDFDHPKSHGFVVPRGEGRDITACTFTSSKWGHTASADYVVIRCYIGRYGDERWLDLDDAEIIRRVRKDLRELIGLQSEPLSTMVNRLPNAMPQYLLHHTNHMERVMQRVQTEMPGIGLAGAAYFGVGVPDCIRHGKQVAEEIINQVFHNK